MIKLAESIYLKRVTIHNRQSGQQPAANRFRDVSVRAGVKPAHPIDGSIIKENEVCGDTVGIAGRNELIHFNCTNVRRVTVVTVQIINDNDSSILHFDEIEFVEESNFITLKEKQLSQIFFPGLVFVTFI